MSYNIQIFSSQTKAKQQTHRQEYFFDNLDNLMPFSDKQFKKLQQRLLNYDYKLTENNPDGLIFTHIEQGTALLTKQGLYFSTDWNENNIFEVGMTASEFCDSDEFAKYDPQQNGWEDI